MLLGSSMLLVSYSIICRGPFSFFVMLSNNLCCRTIVSCGNIKLQLYYLICFTTYITFHAIQSRGSRGIHFLQIHLSIQLKQNLQYIPLGIMKFIISTHCSLFLSFTCSLSCHTINAIVLEQEVFILHAIYQFF